jgi:hypothetical protein
VVTTSGITMSLTKTVGMVYRRSRLKEPKLNSAPRAISARGIAILPSWSIALRSGEGKVH